MAMLSYSYNKAVLTIPAEFLLVLECRLPKAMHDVLCIRYSSESSTKVSTEISADGPLVLSSNCSGGFQSKLDEVRNPTVFCAKPWRLRQGPAGVRTLLVRAADQVKRFAEHLLNDSEHVGLAPYALARCQGFGEALTRGVIDAACLGNDVSAGTLDNGPFQNIVETFDALVQFIANGVHALDQALVLFVRFRAYDASGFDGLLEGLHSHQCRSLGQSLCALLNEL